jgi:hypothetical protein
MGKSGQPTLRPQKSTAAAVRPRKVQICSAQAATCRSMLRIEPGVVNHDATGVAELRAGRPRAGVNAGFDGVNPHDRCPQTLTGL